MQQIANHPLLTLLLNPFAGGAGMNLIAIMFYLTATLCVAVAILERTMHSK